MPEEVVPVSAAQEGLLGRVREDAKAAVIADLQATPVEEAADP